MLEQQLNVSELINRFEDSKAFRFNVTAKKVLPPNPGKFKSFPKDINPRLIQVLSQSGITQLYSHQRQSYDTLSSGENIVVVTPTASGKTLCYNLPVLQSILTKQSTRALYLFPTKALSQDQMHEVHSLIEGLESLEPDNPDLEIKTFTYDGDTPQSARKAIRSQGHIVITNPDMLHTGILPLKGPSGSV